MFRYKYETFPNVTINLSPTETLTNDPNFHFGITFGTSPDALRRLRFSHTYASFRVKVKLFKVCERTTGLNKNQSLMIVLPSSRSSPATGRTSTLPRIIIGNWVTQESGEGPSRTHYSVPQGMSRAMEWCLDPCLPSKKSPVHSDFYLLVKILANNGTHTGEKSGR